ncbi:uncharacterized protein LOC129316435 [Prosopis cineraria]|uniref:uncharacterized protein LOC129316435 n=1 Tax=Prosopis cineraria TaxID=364024 RepID=UPI0024104CB2|nr:uncharacterized protein LOC129316435 [Prosopis cineraria]
MPFALSKITSKACQGMEIRFEDKVSKINLICIPMKGIYVIIGMDWLVVNNAMLDCVRKVVSLPMWSAIMDSSKQPKFLLMVSAKKLIRQGYNAYIVFFAFSTVYDSRIEKIEIASEFPEVFSNVVTSLTSGREVNFSIDLVPRTKPTSKAPYRMSPSTLAELKKQIEDLQIKDSLD